MKKKDSLRYFRGLSIDPSKKRWANIDTGSAPRSQAEFTRGSHLTFSRYFNLVGSQYQEIYCIENFPEGSQPKVKKEICVEFDIDKNRFNSSPAADPQLAPVLGVRALMNKLGDSTSCPKVQAKNIFQSEVSETLGTIPKSTWQPDPLAPFESSPENIRPWTPGASIAAPLPLKPQNSSSGR